MELGKIENEKEVVREAVNGSGKALAIVKAHLTKWFDKAGIDHAVIESKRLSIIALGFVNAEKVQVFDILQEEFINDCI